MRERERECTQALSEKNKARNASNCHIMWLNTFWTVVLFLCFLLTIKFNETPHSLRSKYEVKHEKDVL